MATRNSTEVVKWRDQPHNEHTVWVLTHNDTDGIQGVTSDWMVKERWEKLGGTWDAYFIDDPDAELFDSEDDVIESHEAEA